MIQNFKGSITKEDSKKALLYFYQNTCNALIFFKNEAFKDEKEWRLNELFVKNEKGKYSELKFRERSGIILPYLEFSLCDSDSKIPLASITYALSKDSALTKKSIELLLLKHGYDLKDIEIKESKVPLRFK